MKKLIRTTCAAAIALLAAPLSAHHAANVYYDVTKEISMSGTVTEFRMGNPHARIYFDVTNADGSVTQWMGEGGSRTVMLRRGWTGNEVKVGDKVTLHGHPSRDGGNYMHMMEVEFADGTRRHAEDTDPSNIQNLLERRRQRD